MVDERVERLGYLQKDLKQQADLMGVYDYPTEDYRCANSVIIKGEGYRCSLHYAHEGWAHQNLEMEALWL